MSFSENNGPRRPAPIPSVKICGITNLEDALAAVDAGADGLGFVFYPKSPRRIDPEQAKRIIAKLPPSVVTVGVFVNASLESVQAIRDGCGLTLVQLHGEEPPEYVAPFSGFAVKAIRVRGEADLCDLSRYAVRAFLLDAFLEGVPGGSGKTFDWKLSNLAKAHGRIILSGGLTPENVGAAIRTAAPDGVDVSSGVELRPGKKDVRKLARFIRAARAEGLNRQGDENRGD